MITITKKQFYNKAIWKKKRKEIILKQPFCVMCGSMKQLEVHHMLPIRWTENDDITVEDLSELVNVPLETLCHNCHVAKDKGKGKIASNAVQELINWA